MAWLSPPASCSTPAAVPRHGLAPARVRSRITARSNSARAPKRWKTSLPPGVVVSRCSRRLRKPRPVASSWPTVSIRCLKERPSRSSRQTISESPLRRWSRASARPGRAVLEPLATSVKMRSQPAARRSSSWECRVWLETPSSGDSPTRLKRERFRDRVVPPVPALLVLVGCQLAAVSGRKDGPCGPVRVRSGGDGCQAQPFPTEGPAGVASPVHRGVRALGPAVARQTWAAPPSTKSSTALT